MRAIAAVVITLLWSRTLSAQVYDFASLTGDLLDLE
jgi:hypothetical protein